MKGGESLPAQPPLEKSRSLDNLRAERVGVTEIDATAHHASVEERNHSQLLGPLVDRPVGAVIVGLERVDDLEPPKPAVVSVLD